MNLEAFEVLLSLFALVVLLWLFWPRHPKQFSVMHQQAQQAVKNQPQWTTAPYLLQTSQSQELDKDSFNDNIAYVQDWLVEKFGSGTSCAEFLWFEWDPAVFKRTFRYGIAAGPPRFANAHNDSKVTYIFSCT
jgi:hypothetical protein